MKKPKRILCAVLALLMLLGAAAAVSVQMCIRDRP